MPMTGRLGSFLVVCGLSVAFWPAPGLSETEVAVGKVDDVAAQRVLYLEGPAVFVVATGSEFLALSADSQHVGDRVLFCSSSQTFTSPAHGESFDGLGHYLGGPASGDLGRFQTRVVGDQVVVDLSTVELPPRSETSSAPVGSRCQGGELRPGFFEG